MKTEVIDEPMRDYLARKDYLSASDIKNMATSPLLYHYCQENEKEDTPSTTFGTMVHTAILEPELFKASVVERIEARANSAEYKKWHEKLPEGAMIVSKKDYHRLQHIARNFYDSGLGSLLDVDDAEIEKTVLYEDETGLHLRCRPDFMSKSKRMIVDLKTTSDLKWFASDARKFGYPTSVAHYKTILSSHWGCQADEIEYVFAAVQTSEPYDCDWFLLKTETETNAMKQWLATIENWPELLLQRAGRIGEEPKLI